MLMKIGVGICERQSGLLSLAYFIISRKARDWAQLDTFEGDLLLRVVLKLQNSLKILIKNDDYTQTNRRQLLRIIVKGFPVTAVHSVQIRKEGEGLQEGEVPRDRK